MSDEDDGGPAFPNLSRDAWGKIMTPLPGMSLRDWFAGQVMVGLLTDGNREALPSNRAYAAYAYADAMLAERKK